MFLKHPENNLVVIKYLYMLHIFQPKNKDTGSKKKCDVIVKGTARYVDFHTSCYSGDYMNNYFGFHPS